MSAGGVQQFGSSLVLFGNPSPFEVTILHDVLDDVTIGRPVNDILYNLKVSDVAKVLGLSLNNKK